MRQAGELASKVSEGFTTGLCHMPLFGSLHEGA
jgi:hypothetical protein